MFRVSLEFNIVVLLLLHEIEWSSGFTNRFTNRSDGATSSEYGGVEAIRIVDRSILPSFLSTYGPVHCFVETAVSSLPCEAVSS